MFRPIHIAYAELKRYIADRGSLAFGLALPIVLFALMYGAFGGETAFNGTAHIVDLDPGSKSDELIAGLRGVEGLDIELYTEAEIDDALDRSAVVLAAIIPLDFSAKLEAGEPTNITFRQRGSGGDEGQIVASIIRGIAQSIAGKALVRSQVKDALAGSNIPEAAIDAKVTAVLQQAEQAPPVGVRVENVGAEVDIVNQIMPGLVVMFLLFAVTLGAQTLVEERRIGTLERLLTTRLSIDQLFIGKFLAGVARAMFQAIVLLGLGFVVLRIGGPDVFIQMVVFSILVAAAVSAIGLLIGALARTQDQATWSAVSFTMFMTVFGGTFFTFNEGSPLEIVSRFTLNRYSIDALRDIADGTGALTDQGLEAAVLAGVTVIGLVAARIAFRATEGGR